MGNKQKLKERENPSEESMVFEKPCQIVACSANTRLMRHGRLRLGSRELNDESYRLQPDATEELMLWKGL